MSAGILAKEGGGALEMFTSYTSAYECSLVAARENYSGPAIISFAGRGLTL